MIKRFLIVMLMAAMLAASISGCAYGRIRVAGGSKIGMYTAVMEDLVELWTQHAGLKFSEVASSSGSKANLTTQAQWQCDLAICGADYASWARDGAFAMGGTRSTSSSVLCGLYTDYMHIVVRADTDIKTLAELEGRILMLDQGESTSYYNARSILEKVGVYAVTSGSNFKNATVLRTGSFYDGLLAVQRGEADVVMGIRPLGDRYVHDALNDPDNPLKLMTLDAALPGALTEPYILVEDIDYYGDKIQMAGVKTTLIAPYTMKDTQVIRLLEALSDNVQKLTGERTEEIELADLTKGFDKHLMHPAAREFFVGRGLLTE